MIMMYVMMITRSFEEPASGERYDHIIMDDFMIANDYGVDYD